MLETRVREHDCFGAGRTQEITGREHFDARDLEVGGKHAARITRVDAGEALRQHARLFVRRLDQAVALAAMLGAFADGVNVSDAGLRAVVDNDPAVDRRCPAVRASSTFGRTPIATTTTIGFDHAAVREPHALNATVTFDLGGFGAEQDGNAARLDSRASICAARASSWRSIRRSMR